jgi:hypothetical protein
MVWEHFWKEYSGSLPNDIVGDVSPEELRAMAYDGAKQGLSLKDVVSFVSVFYLTLMY